MTGKSCSPQAMHDPVGLAKLAGIDITTDTPLLDTIAYIGEIIDEIEALTDM